MFQYLEMLPNIYFLKFDEWIDVSLTFWRYQEYYESKHFKGQRLTLLDFIHNYARKHENEFSYLGHWSGFNVPSYILREVWSRPIKDENKYDLALRKLSRRIGKRVFYLVSGFEKADDTVQHELAHGLYAMNDHYRREINRELQQLPQKLTKNAYKVLRKHGYHRCVHRDELHAYLISGQDPELQFKNDDRYRKIFRGIFKKYSRRAKSLLSEMEVL